MKTLILLALIITFCAQINVEGWEGREKFDPNGNHTSHCFGKSYDIGPLDKNERKQVKDCAEAICEENRNIKITGCGLTGVRPPCYLKKGDNSKPFPECCPKVQC